MKHEARALAVLGTVLLLTVTAQGSTRAPLVPSGQEATQLSLDVIAAWVPDSVSIDKVAASPAEGHRFVVLRARPVGDKSTSWKDMAMFDNDLHVVGMTVFPNAGGEIRSSNVVLIDSEGARYTPVGGASVGMAFFRGRSGLAAGLKIVPSHGSAGGPASLALVYEVPTGSSGFKVALGASQPMAVLVDGLPAVPAVGPASGAGEITDQPKPAAQTDPALEVSAAWSTPSITFGRQDIRLGEGNVFLVVAVSVRNSGDGKRLTTAATDTDGKIAGLSVRYENGVSVSSIAARLIDAKGANLEPSGVVVGKSMAFFKPGRTGLASEVNLGDIPAPARDKPASLLLVFEVPKEAAGLQLRMGTDAPMPVPPLAPAKR